MLGVLNKVTPSKFSAQHAAYRTCSVNLTDNYQFMELSGEAQQGLEPTLKCLQWVFDLP